MLALISFILIMVGSVNWFCIGLLQYDFIAGLFGSQASIFSRIIYFAVGLAALVILYNLIVNKGKVVFNFKKKEVKSSQSSDSENKNPLKNLQFEKQQPSTNVEAGKDLDENSEQNNSSINESEKEKSENKN